MANTIITIGRQFGSGGHEIGKIAAKELGIECYDSRLIQMASEKSCIGMEHLKPVDEKRANPWLYTAVSYTHLDVYKRQSLISFRMSWAALLTIKYCW